MKIIVADIFLHKYKRLINLIDLEKLSEKIKSIELINLKFPYQKLKLNIGGIAIRGVLLKTKGGNLIFLILCMKKDKNCGYNLTFESIKKEISNMEVKVLENIEKGNYKIY